MLVEPSRDFSFDLREETNARNVYGGTIGIFQQGRGVVRRFYLGGWIESAEELMRAVQDAVVALRSQMPATGWDWGDLLEQAARADRLEYRQRIKATKSEAQANAVRELDHLIEEEISPLKERIDELEKLLADERDQAQARTVQLDIQGARPFPQVGPEVYEGEAMDRLHLAVKLLLQFADINAQNPEELDERTIAILKMFLKNARLSPAFEEFQRELKMATADTKKLAQRVPPILRRYGYNDKAKTSHLTFEPKSDFEGLPIYTLVKTSSDYRVGKNTLDQLNQAFGLKLLKKYLG